jgi:hypothetical protein
MIDNDIFEWLIQIVSKELKREDFRDEILKPLVRSMISYIMPYVFFIIAMNVFLIILAFTGVLYFLPKR